ncbi:MAG: hypothetical protein PHT12_02420 [Patescibacteria group bacterium]|nr:hypothetical protein [Patescibacteria group bacterium]
MTPFVTKLIEAEKSLARAKGRFVLFGLFKRSDLDDKWDLLVSADWLNERNYQDNFVSIQKTLHRYLGSNINIIARILMIPDNVPFVKSINSAFNIEHGSAVITNCSINNILLERAYLITSNRKKR